MLGFRGNWLATLGVSTWVFTALLSGPAPAQQKTPTRPKASQPKRVPVAAPASQQATVSSTTKHPIETLKVEGAVKIAPEKIIAVSGLKAGQQVGIDDFDAARDKLAATGAFENIGYRFAPSKTGRGYDAVLEVQETGPLFHYRFEDLPATDDALRAVLVKQEPLLGDAIPVNNKILERYQRALMQYLEGKVVVEGRLRSDRPGEPQIVFRPPGDRPRISEVHFTGNTILSTERLADKFALAVIGLPYMEADIRAALDKTIRPMYEAKGRIRVAFPRIAAEKSKQEGVEGVSVTTTIDEGPEYKLGTVRYAGVATKETAPLDKLAAFPTNDTADFDVINAGIERIARRYRGNGFLHTSAKADRTIDDKEHVVNLVVRVEPGDKYTYGKLSIEGLDIISVPAIRKAWNGKEGAPFDPEYPAAFLKDLRDQAVFDNLGQTDSQIKVNEADKTVDVTLIFKGGGGKSGDRRPGARRNF
jgi:outer membrane protein insertion porin family